MRNASIILFRSGQPNAVFRLDSGHPPGGFRAKTNHCPWRTSGFKGISYPPHLENACHKRDAVSTLRPRAVGARAMIVKPRSASQLPISAAE
jgi:hypothetical protein